MHPGRACAGQLLLRRAQDKYYAEQEGVNVGDFGECIVRSLFFDSIPSDCVEIGEIRAVGQAFLLRRFLTSVAKAGAIRGCSVEATFHGTRADNLSSILGR